MQNGTCDTCRTIKYLYNMAEAKYANIPGLNLDVWARCGISAHAMGDKPMACYNMESKTLKFCPECGENVQNILGEQGKAAKDHE